MIIIEYDQNPRVPLVNKVQTLAESVQMALSGIDNELASLSKKHSTDSADLARKIDQLTDAVNALSSQITTMQGQITALEAVADDAIIVDSSVTT